MRADKVEYMDTATVEFKTRQISATTGEETDVTPTTFSAYLETGETLPVQIVQLDNIDVIDDSTYWVRFLASPDTHESITTDTAYYVAFYWESEDGLEHCERHPIAVVANV
jgi:hypothetical protein